MFNFDLTMLEDFPSNVPINLEIRNLAGTTVFWSTTISAAGVVSGSFTAPISADYKIVLSVNNTTGNDIGITIDNFYVYTQPSLSNDYVSLFLPDVLSYNDYYPFGSLVPNRNRSTDDYRYGFQGQEKDDELKGEGNSLNYTFRMHDPRVGRFFAVDPLSKQYPYYSPYQFSGNRVIDAVELEGKEPGFNWGWWFTMAYIKLKLSLSNSVERMASPVTQNNEAINNTPFLSEARKQQLYMVDATTATVDLQGKIMVTSAITSGFVIGGGAVIAESGLASSTVITLNTELSYFASSGPLWKGAFASTFTYEGIVQTSVSTGSVNAFTNLSGQVLSNGGKFDENINLSQPIFAFAFKGLPANLGESSFFLNYKGERDYSSPSQFTSSFTGNLLGGKLNSKLDDLFKPLKDFSITVSPTIDMTVGTGVEVMENAASKEIEELLNAKFSSQSKQAQNNSNKKKKKKTEED